MTNMLNLYLLAIESWIVRMLTEWIWQRPPPIQEDFFAVFLPCCNLIFGFWVAWLQFITGEKGRHVSQRLTGRKDINDGWPEADFSLDIDNIVIVLTGLSVIAYFVNKLWQHCFNQTSAKRSNNILNLG